MFLLTVGILHFADPLSMDYPGEHWSMEYLNGLPMDHGVIRKSDYPDHISRLKLSRYIDYDKNMS